MNLGDFKVTLSINNKLNSANHVFHSSWETEKAAQQICPFVCTEPNSGGGMSKMSQLPVPNKQKIQKRCDYNMIASLFSLSFKTMV